ncbi:hypothetical protein SAQ01S_11440 [Sphingomonas aquatilis NBRC 16722]|nr:hypothetical protein SAQ01S_11440 [Sphingomonas aquatilis NBRC 16722]
MFKLAHRIAPMERAGLYAESGRRSIRGAPGTLPHGYDDALTTQQPVRVQNAPMPPFRSAPPPMPVAALASAAVLAGLLPDTGWSDALALLAITAALFAAHERRHRDMLIAAALSVALSPAGLLLAPLCLGLAIGRGAIRHLPVAAIIGLLVATRLPWTTPAAQLPNLALLPAAWPASLALVAAIGVGTSAWLAARGTITRPAALFAEARLGIVVLAMLLPLPPGVLGFVVMILALPLPTPVRCQAANDNVVVRRPIRLAA